MIALPFGWFTSWTSAAAVPPPPDYVPGTWPAVLDCYAPGDSTPPPSNGYVPSDDPDCVGPEDLI